jgi:anti-sigma-K factor RskA
VIDREQLLDEIAALALGVTEAETADRLRVQIALDRELLAEYQAFRATADLIGFAAEAPPGAIGDLPRARMKAGIMAQVAPQRHEQRVPRAPQPWAAYILSAGALAAAIVALVNSASLQRELGAEREHTAVLQREVTAERSLAETQRRQLADLFAPDSKHYPVAGGEVVTRNGRVYLALRSLPKLPPGKVFQVWTLARGAKNVAPNITFTPNAAGSAIVAVPSVPQKLAAVAVSVEPAGGSKAPSTKPTFIRPLSS